MFRLVHLDEENTEQRALYKYISSAVSKTIIDCLDEYLNHEERYTAFYTSYFLGGFFSGISKYIKPTASRAGSIQADEIVGYEIILSKMKRMKDKMQDKKEYHTFDVFEERILYLMCSIMAHSDRTAEGRKRREPLKEKVETAKVELREKYGLSAKRANDYSRKMYYASAMLLKDDEDDNLIFWDDDYEFYWRDGFIKGIEYLKGAEGQNSGYGYHYVCDIFSDIGIKPPLMLVGTEEANRIATEVQNERIREKMNDFFKDIVNAKSIEDVQRKYGDNDDGLPFN